MFYQNWMFRVKVIEFSVKMIFTLKLIRILTNRLYLQEEKIEILLSLSV